MKEDWTKEFDKLWQKEFSAPTSNENEFVCLGNKWVKAFIRNLLAKERKRLLEEVEGYIEDMPQHFQGKGLGYYVSYESLDKVIARLKKEKA